MDLDESDDVVRRVFHDADCVMKNTYLSILCGSVSCVTRASRLDVLRSIVRERVDSEGLRPLAASIGVSVGQLRSLKSNRRVLSDTLESVSDALGLEIYIGPPRDTVAYVLDEGTIGWPSMVREESPPYDPGLESDGPAFRDVPDDDRRRVNSRLSGLVARLEAAWRAAAPHERDHIEAVIASVVELIAARGRRAR